MTNNCINCKIIINKHKHDDLFIHNLTIKLSYVQDGQKLGTSYFIIETEMFYFVIKVYLVYLGYSENNGARGGESCLVHRHPTL